MARQMKVRFLRTRDWAGLVAIALVVVMLFSEGAAAQMLLYAAALALLGALFLLAEEDLEARHQHYIARPQTGLGRVSVWATLAGVALALGLPLAMTSSDASTLTLASAGLVVMGASGAVGLVSWFKDDERSWMVLLTVLTGMGAVAYLLSELMYG